MRLLYRHRRPATAMAPRPASAWGSPIQACVDHGRDSRVGRIWAKAERPNDGISTEGQETAMLSFLRQRASATLASLGQLKDFFMGLQYITYMHTYAAGPLDFGGPVRPHTLTSLRAGPAPRRSRRVAGRTRPKRRKAATWGRVASRTRPKMRKCCQQ